MSKFPLANWRPLKAFSIGLLAVVAAISSAQVPMFGGNAQHTSLYTTPPQEMNKIRWQTTIDYSPNGGFAHYGAPVITANNTVITTVLDQNTNVLLSGFDGANGNLKYTLASDYLFPAHNWFPEYQPCLVGNRLYYAGPGGTIYFVDNANTDTPSAPTQEVFYTDLQTYQANAAAFYSTVYEDTPITADSQGNIYFGFRMQGTAPAPLNSSMSGYAKITPAGVGTYVFVDAMTGDPNITRDCHNTAPALSNDESKLYVVAKWGTNSYYSYLVALNTSDMSTSSKVFLQDPRNGNNAGALDDGTASPMVGPDGDVYLGVFANPYNGSRGFLAHFSGDLSETKIPGGFGWDFTPGVVPASMVPGYHGSSSYLLFRKYNNYLGVGDGSGVNRVAIVDPNAAETDANPSGGGVQIMREVRTVIGFTPDEENPDTPFAVREMCVNSTAVNAVSNSVFFNSEDGRAYRWDLHDNMVTQSVPLTQGFGEPYVPTVIGPDGTIYTINGGNLFALGSEDHDQMQISSNKADSRTALNTDSVTFTAHIGILPSSVQQQGVSQNMVTFTDNYYDGFNWVTNPLGTVPPDGLGNAQVTTTLAATDTAWGNHFITAAWSGTAGDLPVSATAVQKVHQFASSTALQAVGNPSPYGQPVILTATVTGVGTSKIPTGQVTFLNDGNVMGQVPLDGSGQCSFTANNLAAGVRDLQAEYQSDTIFALSSNIQEVTISEDTNLAVGSSPNPSTFGTSVTFTATVTPADSGAGTPTGSVVFTIDGTPSAPVAVDGTGKATLQTSTLAVGSHTVSADFTGSNGFGNSNASGSNQQVNDGTSTGLVSSVNPTTSGQSTTFTATVTAADSGAGTPTGSVTFKDGSTTLASNVAVNGSGQASFSTNALSNGSHSITANFTGTGGWQNSNGGVTQVVNGVAGGTTTDLKSNHNPSKVGQSVLFTATVSGTGGKPTGSVTFVDGGTTLGTVAINGGGKATFTTSSLTLGDHTIHANFVGTNGWQNSSDQLTQHVVVDITKPSVPQNIHATPGPTNGHITVTWDRSTDPDDAVDHYEVWSSVHMFGGYKRVSVQSSRTFVDNPGPGKRRLYNIVAVDSHGNKSAHSATAIAFGM